MHLTERVVDKKSFVNHNLYVLLIQTNLQLLGESYVYVLCFNLDSLTRKAFCLMLNLCLLRSTLLYNSVMGIVLSASKIGLEGESNAALAILRTARFWIVYSLLVLEKEVVPHTRKH